MLKTSPTQSAEPLLLLVDVISNDEIGSSGSSDEIVERSLLHPKLRVKATDYLTSAAKAVFSQLRNTFTKASILHHFDLEWNISIETNISGYFIDRILTQLILNILG